MFLFAHHGVKITSERRSSPTTESVLALLRAGERDKARALRNERVEAEKSLPGLVLWHMRQEGEEAICYFADCKPYLVTHVLHAAKCGCDGCWHRLQSDKSFLESRGL
jgi:hypothetical protein